MKKSLIVTAALTLSLLGAGTAGAASSAVSVSVDGKAVVFNTAPVVRQNTTLVQIAPIFRSLGIDFVWDQKKKQITATKNGKTIVMTMGSKDVYVDGQKITISQAPQSINGNIFVPLRFISEATGANVKVNGSKIEVTSVKLVDNSAKIEAYLAQHYPTLQNGDRTYKIGYWVRFDTTGNFYSIYITPASLDDMMQMLNDRTETNTVVGPLTRAVSDDLHQQFGIPVTSFMIAYTEETPTLPDLEFSPDFVGLFEIGELEDGSFTITPPSYSAVYDYAAGKAHFYLFTNDYENTDNLMFPIGESDL